MFSCVSGDQNKTYRDSFLRQTIPAYVAQYKAPAVILGDFNAVDEIDDRKSSKTTPSKIRLALGITTWGSQTNRRVYKQHHPSSCSEKQIKGFIET